MVSDIWSLPEKKEGGGLKMCKESYLPLDTPVQSPDLIEPMTVSLDIVCGSDILRQLRGKFIPVKTIFPSTFHPLSVMSQTPLSFFINFIKVKINLFFKQKTSI